MNIDKDKMIENAITWAKKYLGTTEYTYRCLGFVEDALERSNGIEIFGGDTAKESADRYNVYESVGVPPKGAFVFYDCVGKINGEHKNWGHVGLAVEDGVVIHTWDEIRMDGYLDVEHLNVAESWHKPKYIGYTELDKILVGYELKSYNQ